MYSPNVPAPESVVEAVRRYVRDTRPRTFLDAGCGDGTILAAAAEASPASRLIGIDVDGDGLRRARRLLPHATLLQGDFFAFPELLDDADVVYSYTGAATHQRLGLVLSSRSSGSILTALYRAYGTPNERVLVYAPIPVYEYRLGTPSAEWDAPCSLSLTAPAGTQLTSRAVRVQGGGALAVVASPEHRSLTTVAGRSGVRPGDVVFIDFVVHSTARHTWTARATVRVEVDGRPASGSHVVVFGSRAGAPVDWSGEPEELPRRLRSQFDHDLDPATPELQSCFDALTKPAISTLVTRENV